MEKGILRITLAALVFFTIIACKNETSSKEKVNENSTTTAQNFQGEKWKIKEGNDYPYRDKMLQNLLESKQLKQLKRDQIFSLLGSPDRVDSNYLFYRVAQQRIGFFPLHTKTLVIKLNEDSTVLWTKIHQ